MAKRPRPGTTLALLGTVLLGMAHFRALHQSTGMCDLKFTWEQAQLFGLSGTVEMMWHLTKKDYTRIYMLF